MRRGGKDRKGLEAQLDEARSRIAELENELAQGTTRDSLTPNLLTLRAFHSQLELDVERARRYARPLSLAILDVDHFARFNAEQGYEAGDALLVEIAGTISDSTRVNDIACRLAGDEFAVLYPETRTADARGGLDRMVRAIGMLGSGPEKAMTVSAGLVPLVEDQEPSRLLAAAREALQQAREQGGARVVELSGEQEVGRDAPGDAPPPRNPGITDELAAVEAGAIETLEAAERGAPGPPAPAPASDDPEPKPPAGSLEPAATTKPGPVDRDEPAPRSTPSPRSRPHRDQPPASTLADSAAAVAEALGLQSDEVEMARTVARLDDRGTGAEGEDAARLIDDLDASAWERARGDRGAAAKLLASLEGREELALALRSLDERWDGRGEPDGLLRSELPAPSRVVAAVGEYHRLVSEAPLGSGLDRSQALREVAGGSGRRFDPEVVNALIKHAFGHLG